MDWKLIDQVALSEPCPCNSDRAFGACCGQELLCDCNSKWSAGECCFSEGSEDEDVISTA